MAQRTPRRTAFQRKNNPRDPYVYLFVEGEWYCYDPSTEPLGEGAMGIVWQGYRVNTGEKVAVKKVKERFQNVRIIRDRAQLEATMAFRHPNLIEMIGCCMLFPGAQEGPVWLVSNFVEGQEIDKFLAHVPEGEAKQTFICKAMCQVLDALGYIHSKGITHRDIKPSNIMVEKEANVRLMDMGIARVSGGNRVTFAGSFIGTPQYAAPEQISGQSINAATDIYALGITFYELLTGINPFDGESSSGDMDNELFLNEHLSMVLPPNTNVPKRLYQVLLKATDASQAKRYQNAAEFRMAIQQAMTAPTTIWERIRNLFAR